MSKKNLIKQKVSKKDIKSIVYNKLALALSDFKKEMKPKKFESKLKKASKLFVTGVKETKVKIKKSEKKGSKTKVSQKHEQQAAS